ncbi:MAG: hypothetical protein M1829_005310 [Trizodia sp. TS-e1964]|nr:MAG: hypothetical protein M1829_005310 [Trizodia sp. TS-e1964]
MPRSSASTPKRLAANQHNTRHESGLAAPGRRVAKQRSIGFLNSVAAAKQQSAPPPPHLHANSSLTHQDVLAHGASRPLVEHSEDSFESDIASESEREQLEISDEKPDDEDTLPVDPTISSKRRHHRIDVNAFPRPSVHHGSLVNLTSTILKSCPLADTIAILIILLQIPPTCITIIQLLFASLTIISPSGTWPTAHYSDWFQASGGMPSLATIAVADCAFLLVWLFLWAPAQYYALDLAQTVIAITLGGGIRGRDSGPQSTIACVGLVTAFHLAPRKYIRSSARWSSSQLPFAAVMGRFAWWGTEHYQRTDNGWLRSILAAHILTQGLVRIIRRWISRREMATNAGKPPNLALQAANYNKSEAIPSPQSSGNSLNSADRISILPFGSSNGKEKILTGKKRRRQGTQARCQQPLWAALASTKITMVKETEKSRAMAEAAEKVSSEKKSLASGIFNVDEERIWISHIGSTHIGFGTSRFPRPVELPASLHGSTFSSPHPNSPGASPFQIRVNKADWISTQITAVAQDKEDHEDSAWLDWTGEIFGLTPMSSYEIEFLSVGNDNLIYSTSVSTQPAKPSADIVYPQPASLPPQSLRPLSPTTTLKNSIASAEARLNEEKGRAKRARKDHKAALALSKKEVEIQNARLATCGSSDDKQRQRGMQIRQLIRQAEDASEAISAQVDILSGSPGQGYGDWKDQKSNWEAEKSRQSIKQEGLAQFRSNIEREMKTIKSEATNLLQKRDRLQARLARIHEQYERINNANIQGLDEKERKAAEDATKEAERLNREQLWMDNTNTLGQYVHETHSRTQQVWQQVRSIEVAYQQQQRQIHEHMFPISPTTPEGNIPGTVPLNSQHSRFGGFAFPPSALSLQPVSFSRPESLKVEGRGRSDSMRSAASGISDFSDADPAPPMPSDTKAMVNYKVGRRVKSDGSGSGSGSVSGSGSLQDPTSPLRTTLANPINGSPV